MGLTQKGLAALCGIHFTHVCHIERGNANPSLEVFVKLIEELNVSPAKLLDMLRQRSEKAGASVTDIQKARERRKRR
jgi:transcriptional regulator with XRE-family HTH domain